MTSLTSSMSLRIQAVQNTLPSSVRLIAVTKRFPSDVIRQAYALGLRDFGEAQVQEAQEKQAQLGDLNDITWHLIGHLQSNKARKALELFQWIHSIDSFKLAQKLNQIAAETTRHPNCCLQVKLRSDPAKYGFDLETLRQTLPRLNTLENLHIKGLMTIPPLGLSKEEIRALFLQAQALADDINRIGYSHLQATELSMGMSGDYPEAIAAGATMVRLGAALFGTRP